MKPRPRLTTDHADLFDRLDHTELIVHSHQANERGSSAFFERNLYGDGVNKPVPIDGEKPKPATAALETLERLQDRRMLTTLTDDEEIWMSCA